MKYEDKVKRDITVKYTRNSKINCMVEVFKTNVEDRDHAKVLVNEIHQSFSHYAANFDLEDCDNILRVKYISSIDTDSVIALLHRYGYDAEILSDEIMPSKLNRAY